MKKNKFIKFVALVIVTVMFCGIFSACEAGGSFGGNTELSFWVYGDKEELALYKSMTDEFNNTYGKEQKIHVNISQKPTGGYADQVKLYATSRSGPDVFFVYEDVFKSWVNMGILADMTEYIDAAAQKIDISDIYETVVSRMRCEVSTNTSNPDDPLYGLPLDTKPTALYYNESFFKELGIIVISVDEEDMDKWNKNEIPDKRGQYKRDFEKLNLNGINVPKKGYYRSEYPYAYTDDNWSKWEKPSDTEILVFNNRIALNWDELEDLARLFTPKYNDAAEDLVGSDGYGFFTEWWFNYGWSVGGDCLMDLSGSGNWNFSLLDYTANFIVAEGNTYVGEYSGTTYKSGETLTLQDKLALNKGKYLVADDVGGYHEKDSASAELSSEELSGNGALRIRQTVTEAAKSGVLNELPSTREAFTRYLKLGAKTNASIEGEGGLDISPNPIVFSSRTRTNYFYSGKLAMLVEYSAYMSAISEQMDAHSWEWDVAPLAVYKQYEDPTDPDCDTVVAKGKVAGHSNSKAMVSREKSNNKEEAAEFMAWMASRNGQTIAAQNGFFTNQLDLVDDIQFKGYAPKNVQVFGEAMSYEGPGDWWYMKDFEWINIWAVPLNSNVRNGLMTYSEWKKDAIKATNNRLLSY